MKDTFRLLAFLLPALLAPVPGTAQPKRDPAKIAACWSNLKQLGTGALMFAQDHKQVFPKAAHFAAASQQLQPYIRNTGVFACPENGKAYLFNTQLSGANLASIKEPAKTPIFKDSKPHVDGSVAVGFVDGHVKGCSGAEAAKLGGTWK
jgi:hypothetical protein